MRCITFEKLLAFSNKECSPAEATRIRNHLAGCAACQQNVHWLELVVTVAATDGAVDPPTWLVQQALELFKLHRPEPKKGLLQKLVASLVFDTLTQPGWAGVRALGLATRQCLYRCAGYDLDLSFEPAESPTQVNVNGQLLGPSENFEEVANASVQLMRGGEVVLETMTNRLGEFTIDQVQKGVYGLRIQLPEKEIGITELDVRAAEE